MSQVPLSTRFTFKVAEYLKGSGPKEFTVAAETLDVERDGTWDDREALLFLNSQEVHSVAGTEGASTGHSDRTFVFTPVSYYHPDEYTIDSLNPVWLPAVEPSQADGASAASGLTATTSFATEWDSASNRPGETVTLKGIKEMIAWEKGDGTPQYKNCVAQAVQYTRYFWPLAVHEVPYTPGHHKHSIPSGVAAREIGTDMGLHTFKSKQYNKFWLTGEDAELFEAATVDDDTDPYNGYIHELNTGRPLPDGGYEFTSHIISADYFPCGFNPENHRLNLTVTAVAPAGTLHEAFFDPVAIGQGVGANASNGVLKPMAITAEGFTATIKSLVWQDKKVIMTLSPYVSLLGQTLDFIALDGTVALSLEAKSATVDASAGTYTWSQATRPWNAGDRLMLRLHGPTVSIVDASGPEGEEVEFQVALSEAVDHEVRVSWEAEFHDTAKNYAVPSEYWHMSGELVFQPGETSRSAEVFLNDDDWREDDEVFLVILSNPKGAIISDGEGLMTIIDDD